MEGGWRPTAFHQFVLKLHSRCNLACDYCYMYEMADQGWRLQPRRMSRPIIDSAAARIAEHARSHGLDLVEVVLHGGEPQLAGVDHLRYAVSALRQAMPPGVRLTAQVQTNGTLLDGPFLDLFADLGVRVGVSLDGGREEHDRHRRRPMGEGSYEEVRARLDLLTTEKYRHLFGGLLCTIDLANDPVATYEALLEVGPPFVDFLLPHGNWNTPPPGWSPEHPHYGEWLIRIFDRWYEAPRRETHIRLFHQIMLLAAGRASRSESVGLSPAAHVVVETNGGIEQVDTLKAAYPGAAATPLHVLRDPFDRALLLPAVAARQIGARALSDTCAACDIHQICGAGLYSHRYRPGAGFRNPSVYCLDLYRLITHVRRRFDADRKARQASAGPGG
ncbi:FxsB family radical SAM/SPASM domain protein [Nonomuraea sp. C10]|nr:FxsB family radical SAM/SPASM domain protein [Nonomuraea sp. C10]